MNGNCVSVRTRPGHGIARPGACNGFTLVELMVGIVVGMLVITAMALLFANSSAARAEMDRASQQIENGRVALQILRDDIHQAGFFGGYSGGVRRIVDACVPRAALVLSAGALGWQSSPASVPLPIHGYAAGETPAAETCITNQQPGTDALVLRSVDSSSVAVSSVTGAASATDYYLQTSACADPVLDAPDRPFVVAAGGSGAAATFTLHQKDCSTLAPLRKLIVRAYYIGKCSVCSGSGDGIPTLRMVELEGATATSQSVVEGIDSMHIEYALDTDNDGAFDAVRRCRASTDPCAVADWQNVMAVRVFLLARNLTPSPAYLDTKTYDMGLAGVIGPANDRFKRHLYSATVTAFNQTGPRER
ncbi:MAG: PilW family protein [Betaproteobacteria bacterium]